MKRNIIWSIMLVTFAIASCTRGTEKETTTAPPPAQDKTVVADTLQKEGTTIKMSNDGVSIESKDGSKKTNVKISSDSSSLELSRPK